MPKRYRIEICYKNEKQKQEVEDVAAKQGLKASTFIKVLVSTYIKKLKRRQK